MKTSNTEMEKVINKIYNNACKRLIEDCESEMNEIIETKSQEKFDSLVKKVNREMIAAKEITPADVEVYFDTWHIIARALNDALVMQMQINANK